jgi:hypothetical protein
MRWNLISSLTTNSKVVVLLIILFIFLILTVFIIMLELKQKKRKTKKFTEDVENVRITLLKKELRKTRTSHERLAIIDKQAKSLFRERFHIGRKKSYSELVEQFNEKKLYNYSAFAQKMFEAYYSENGVDESTIRDLVFLLTRLIRETTIYLDPEKYSIENILPKETESHEAKEHSSSKTIQLKTAQLDKRKELLSKRQRSLMEKQMLFNEKQKTLTKKEREISKQEKVNEKILKEIENKLKEQEHKIKKQEDLQEKISKQLKKEEIQKRRIEEAISNKKILDSKMKEKEIERSWRESIEVNPTVGKEWLKTRKRRGNKNR